MNDIHLNNGYRLRPATMDEIPVKWDENYPTVPILENDVRRGWGYVLVPSENDSDIIAYGAVVFDGEPAYSGLWDGQWLSEQPYVVLHRLAVADRWKRQGMAVRYMQAQGRHQLRQLLYAARLLPPRLHLLRPHPLRCRRTHGLRKTAVNINSKFFLHLLFY